MPTLNSTDLEELDRKKEKRPYRNDSLVRYGRPVMKRLFLLIDPLHYDMVLLDFSIQGGFGNLQAGCRRG